LLFDFCHLSLFLILVFPEKICNNRIVVKKSITQVLDRGLKYLPFIGACSVFFLFSALSIVAFIFSPLQREILGASQKTASGSTTVSLSIGIYRFTLFGYTSPEALVSLQGMGIVDETIANSQGYFEFNNRFSPFSPREACLTSRDQFGRLSAPVCLPPFPTRYDVRIGPVLMPPTLSFDKNDYFMGDEIVLSGQGIPNTDVDFSVFIDDKQSFVKYLTKLFSFPKPAYALTFPKFTTESDADGNFSLSIPSSNPDIYRLFAQSFFQKEISPKSNTLNVKILPIWMLIIKFLLFLFSLLKSHLLEFLILTQLFGIVVYFLRRYLKPYVIAHTRALALRAHYELLLKEHAIIPSRYSSQLTG